MAEVTNYIDRLVAELCPDGVDFYTIDELITLDFGTRITKSKDAGTIYPVYGGGGASFRTDNYNREDKYVVSRFAMSEKCVRYVSGKFWMLDSGFTYSVKDESLLSYKYISYWLLNAQQEIYACSSQSAQRNLKTAEFKRFEVPVPPLEVQEAIVEILDKFTNLEAELEAELEARTLQYEYYRDSLFEALDCPRVPLGSFAQLVRGSGMPKTDFSESGVGAIHYGQIYTKFGTATAEVIAHVPEEKAKKLAVVNPGDVIVANTSENLEDVCKAVAWVGDSDIVTGGHATVIKAPEQNAKFISYYMATGQFNKDKRRHAFGTKVIDVAPKNLAKIEFPLPSLEEQQRIVDILDRFDALTTSLSEGLPAELAARRSQYEYYRDQLLSFPRKGENH
ncbi:restriction endonuclease subunit S [uncultured Rothia sp.]|uniref:restriction endonuclease subunit S n=1 Tax=uncultured Rothia sp. TaxID=316088 RepID=UPI0028DB0570|nr:restriction endonuclease subunit S [uncultured Rothia sp.]